MISLSVLLVALGILAGLARGGRVGNMTLSRFRFRPLVFTGLLLQLAAEVYGALVDSDLRDGPWALAALALSYALLLAFVSFNFKMQGMAPIGLGLALNLAVILPNGGMPVSGSAASAAGLDTSNLLQGSVKHRPLDAETKLALLSDVFPLPGLRTVVSAGDIVFGTGVFFLVEGLVRYRPKRLSSAGGRRRRWSAKPDLPP